MSFKTTAISQELREQIDDMIEKIKSSFGIELSKIKASRIVAWKSKCYNVQLTEKKLLEILGGKI